MGWQLVRGAPFIPEPKTRKWHKDAKDDFLQGTVTYGNISNLETHFSVKYDNISYNQVGNLKHKHMTIEIQTPIKIFRCR